MYPNGCQSQLQPDYTTSSGKRMVNTMNRINLVVLLEQLEGLGEKAPGIPLTGKVLIDADELLDLIDQIRGSVPEEVRRAEAVSVEKDRVIAEGQQKAERIVAQAEEYASKLIKESEIHRQAEQEARRIVEEASQRAQEIRRGADEYADQVLRNLQDALEKTLSVVSKGREQLNQNVNV